MHQNGLLRLFKISYRFNGFNVSPCLIVGSLAWKFVPIEDNLTDQWNWIEMDLHLSVETFDILISFVHICFRLDW